MLLQLCKTICNRRRHCRVVMHAHVLAIFIYSTQGQSTIVMSRPKEMPLSQNREPPFYIAHGRRQHRAELYPIRLRHHKNKRGINVKKIINMKKRQPLHNTSHAACPPKAWFSSLFFLRSHHHGIWQFYASNTSIRFPTLFFDTAVPLSGIPLTGSGACSHLRRAASTIPSYQMLAILRYPTSVG